MMNLKYYLRGLGVGIIVTALIMGIALGGKKETIGTEEIKERARALGMTEENRVLADAVSSPTPAAEGMPSPTSTPAKTDEPAKTPSPDAVKEPDTTPAMEPTAAPTEKPAEQPTAAPTQKPDTAQEGAGDGAQSTGTVTIQVNSGDGSLTVSRKLEEAGLVDSAFDFDQYLCQNGYDKRLNVGTFEIPVGASGEEIAKILARLD